MHSEQAKLRGFRVNMNGGEKKMTAKQLMDKYLSEIQERLKEEAPEYVKKVNEVD